MKTIFFIFLSVFYTVISYAQNFDSLKVIISEKQGNEKSLELLKIGKLYKQNNEFDSAVFYLERSLNNNFSEEEKSNIYEDIGMMFFYKSNFLKTLDNFKLSLYYAKEFGSDSIIARRYSDIGVTYDYLGAYDKSVKYYYKALEIFEKENDKLGMAKIYNNIGIIMQNRGNANEALGFYKKSLKLKIEEHDSDVQIASAYINLGSAYELLKKYDKSLSFYDKSLKLYRNNSKKYFSLTLSNIANVYFLKMDLDSAFIFNNASLKINDSINNKFGLIGNYRLWGNILRQQNQVDSAIFYLKKALIISDTLNVMEAKKKTLTSLVKTYKQKYDFDKAFFYQEKLIAINDTLNNEKTNNKIETLKIVYETEKKEKEISNLQEKIKRTRTLQGIIAFAIILFGVIVFLIFKQKLAKSKYEARIFNQKLLRLQMNPHFIFNALASIQSFMFEEDVKKAAMYLSSFSKLTRAILNNSREEFITLQEDIETIENYLKIQQMRFENSFDYEIIIDDIIDTDNVQVPPMLIQPFVENAVVHGFKDISYKGHIEVEYLKKDDSIKVIIKDNGKGFVQEKNIKHKSHAIKITQERLKILNKNKKELIAFKIINNNDKGVKVVFQYQFRKKSLNV